MSLKSSVNNRVRCLWPAIVAGLPLLIAASAACSLGLDHNGPCGDSVCSDNNNNYTPVGGMEIVPIAVGETLETAPGEGVGVFVEYLGEGDWNVWTTCDTDFSGLSCSYEIFVWVDEASLRDDIDVEEGDFVEEDIGFLHAGFTTDSDTDSLPFSTYDDGGGTHAGVEIEVWLEGEPNGSVVFWTANDTIYEGLPSNPALFQP